MQGVHADKPGSVQFILRHQTKVSGLCIWRVADLLNKALRLYLVAMQQKKQQFAVQSTLQNVCLVGMQTFICPKNKHPFAENKGR